jgi:hypothetical protein
MNLSLFQLLLVVLLLWSLVGMGSAILGLYLEPGELMRSFWLMSGLWALVDGGIVWVAMIRPVPTPAELAPILKFNAGLDVLYLVAAGVLVSRATPRLKGFGSAVALHGAFLLVFDVSFYLAGAGALG